MFTVVFTVRSSLVCSHSFSASNLIEGLFEEDSELELMVGHLQEAEAALIFLWDASQEGIDTKDIENYFDCIPALLRDVKEVRCFSFSSSTVEASEAISAAVR